MNEFVDNETRDQVFKNLSAFHMNKVLCLFITRAALTAKQVVLPGHLVILDSSCAIIVQELIEVLESLLPS